MKRGIRVPGCEEMSKTCPMPFSHSKFTWRMHWESCLTFHMALLLNQVVRELAKSRTTFAGVPVGFFNPPLVSGVMHTAGLGFSQNPPEEWMARGIIILTRETKIAEMSFLDHCQIDFPLKTFLGQPKLKIFAWEFIENPKKSGNLMICLTFCKRILIFLSKIKNFDYFCGRS